jgi:hypothetical protein
LAAVSTGAEGTHEIDSETAHAWHNEAMDQSYRAVASGLTWHSKLALRRSLYGGTASE